MKRQDARPSATRRRGVLSWLSCLVVSGGLTPFALSADSGSVAAVAATLIDDLTKAGKMTVAVVDFTDLEGRPTLLGRYLAEELAVALAAKRSEVRIVDRTHLNALLAEHRLASTGLIDPQTARRIGELAGAQALVTGSMTPFADNIRVTVKVLDTATAQLVSATALDLPRTRTIEELLKQGERAKGGEVGVTKDVSATPAEGAAREVAQDGMLFRLSPCSTKGGRVECPLVVSNESGDRMRFTLYRQYGFRNDLRTYLVAPNGEQHFASEVALGGVRASGGTHFVAQELEPGLPMKAGVVFEGPAQAAAAGALVLVFQTPRGLKKATFPPAGR